MTATPWSPRPSSNDDPALGAAAEVESATRPRWRMAVRVVNAAIVERPALGELSA